MSDVTLGAMLLASTRPEELRDWYVAVFAPEVSQESGYAVLNFGGFYVMIDTRDDVGDRNPEPGRVLFNYDVSDAREIARRLDERGADWVSPLEDRDGSLFGTVTDPDGNYVQIVQLSEAARAEMEHS